MRLSSVIHPWPDLPMTFDTVEHGMLSEDRWSLIQHLDYRNPPHLCSVPFLNVLSHFQPELFLCFFHNCLSQHPVFSILSFYFVSFRAFSSPMFPNTTHTPMILKFSSSAWHLLQRPEPGILVLLNIWIRNSLLEIYGIKWTNPISLFKFAPPFIPQHNEEIIHTHSVPKPEVLTSEIPLRYFFLSLAHSPSNQPL